jgi:hypothetical protein
MSLLLRFVIGGFVVCTFASLGDALQPKSFAGLFGAAPSVALASLAITMQTEGMSYALAETRSMVVGSVAFLVYAVTCTHLLARRRWRAISASTFALTVWLFCAFALRFLLLR